MKARIKAMLDENNNLSENGEENNNIQEPEQTSDTPEDTQPAGESGECKALFDTSGAGGAPDIPKPRRRFTLTTLICTCVSLVLAAVMLTYTLCTTSYQARLAQLSQQKTPQRQPIELAYELDVLSQIFEAYSFNDLDEDALRAAVLKAYVEATGDRYAEYYTEEEYRILSQQLAGQAYGVGINYVESAVIVNGSAYKALKVVNVVKGSPAQEAGLLIGDMIAFVGTEESYQTVDQLGYDNAVAALHGDVGTMAEFGFFREGESAPIFRSVERKEIHTTSVMGKKVDGDVGENIGLIKIIQFDFTTPIQLSDEVDALLAQGCNKFVFDVRNNRGGELSSIVATLSYFLQEGDRIISTKDRAGNEQVINVGVVDDSDGCNVKAEDIGKYKDLNMVVLCNEMTASAAELFVANFRDHGLGAIVGQKTYGKGSMQTYVNLARFNCKGVLKITAHMYFAPNGESYDGIGIYPDAGCEVALSEQAKNMSVYESMGKSVDNQLVEAVKHFK